MLRRVYLQQRVLKSTLVLVRFYSFDPFYAHFPHNFNDVQDSAKVASEYLRVLTKRRTWCQGYIQAFLLKRN